MKKSCTLFALCYALHTTATTAFVVQTPITTRTAQAERSNNSRLSSDGNNGFAEAWESAEPVLIQGSTLRTWSFRTAKKVQVLMKTDGRPLHANVDLWHSPTYTPAKMSVYLEDGEVRPFRAYMMTKAPTDSIQIRNTHPMEFPLQAACIEEGEVDDDGYAITGYEAITETIKPRLIQGGGSVASFPIPIHVDSVQILMKSDGRNMKARVELMQGPNNDKQIIEFYASDGKKTPFYAAVETPGTGNVVRIVNENTVEFPFSAYVVASGTGEALSDFEVGSITNMNSRPGGFSSAGKQWWQ